MVTTRSLAFLACLLTFPAFAEQQPENLALGQEIMECVGGKVQLRVRIAQLEAEIAKLKSQEAPK